MRNSSLSLISWCAGQVWGLCVWWFVVCRSLSLIWRARVARVVPPAAGLGHCSGCEAFLRCAPCVCGRNFEESGWRRLGELVQSEVVHQHQEQNQVGKPGKGWWVPPSGSQLGGHVQAGPVEEVGTLGKACTPLLLHASRRQSMAPVGGCTNLPPPWWHQPATTLPDLRPWAAHERDQCSDFKGLSGLLYALILSEEKVIGTSSTAQRDIC